MKKQKRAITIVDCSPKIWHDVYDFLVRIKATKIEIGSHEFKIDANVNFDGCKTAKEIEKRIMKFQKDNRNNIFEMFGVKDDIMLHETLRKLAYGYGTLPWTFHLVRGKDFSLLPEK